MFSRQRRKARFLFGLSDILITALAFEAAYRTRILLHLGRVFYIILPMKALVMGFTVGVWLLIGLWLGVYDRLDAGDPRVILRDSFRQCLYGAVALILFEFSLRLDLSRPFLALFMVYAWVLLFLFRLFSGRMAGAIRRAPASAPVSWARRWNGPPITESASRVFWRRNRTTRSARSAWHLLTRSTPSANCGNYCATA
jgi:hypothetical protein